MDPSLFDVHFSHNIIKSIEQEGNPLFANCDMCLYTSIQDTLFVSVDENNYSLDSNSIAEMKAIPIIDLQYDLLGHRRDELSPDIGCYEYQN